MGPGKRFTPAHEEWIWKTSRVYILMHRAAHKCTVRETTTFTARSLTSVSSNSLGLGIVNRRGFIMKFNKVLFCMFLFSLALTVHKTQLLYTTDRVTDQ